ncbi:MAG TPA: hypothetical protein VGB42_05890, partial [Candidatus Thermoplasmatota archaeon]
MQRHQRARTGHLRRTVALLALLNVGLPILPLGAAAAWAGPSPEFTALPPVAGPAVWPPARGAPPSPVAPAATASLAPAPPAPLSAGTAAQNYSPHAPSAFTWDALSLQPRYDAAAMGGLPMVLVNQSGTVGLRLNGTWNPSPAQTADRAWALLLLVANGRASARTIEANASASVALGPSQVPARLYFALPSPVNFSGAYSTVQVDATLPGGNATRLNLTVAASGLNFRPRQYIAPVASASIWFNASGAYDPGDILAVGQNLTLVLPLNGLPPVAVSSGQVVHWTGPGNFPGARAALVATVVPLGGNPGNQALMVWTRGSPESGLFLNASAAPANVSRGGDLSISGVAGNRTLTASTNWTVNTTAVLAPNHDHANCTNLLRLQNGSWRLFCAFEDVGANSSLMGGLSSAFSPDGATWSWEAGVRHQVCAGAHPIDQATIVRLIDGRLRLYYTGREAPPTCGTNAATHLSTAVSSDEGVTWALENEDFGAISSVLVAPTADGFMRFYFGNSSGIQSAVFNSAAAFADGPNLAMDFPRAVYLLTDGSYKMYYGTTAVYSSTSPNGLNWSAGRLEVANWSGDIEAGPLLDPGDGSLSMLLYSQSGGLYLARLNATVARATVTTTGATSYGGSFAAPPVNSSAADGAFQVNATLPAGGTVGEYRVTIGAWFGEVTLSGGIVNRPPQWAGPPSVSAVEDVTLVLDLAAWASDPDAADTISIGATSAYGTLSGALLTLDYGEGVLADTVQGTVSDGIETVAFQFNVSVSAVDDPPWFLPDPRYVVVEDSPSVIDLNGTFGDVDTPAGQLVLTTSLAGATVAGSRVTVTFNLDGDYSVAFSVSDGNSAVDATVVIEVTPVDDPPVLDLPAIFLGGEDTLVVLDLAPSVSDEDTPGAGLLVSTDLPG